MDLQLLFGWLASIFMVCGYIPQAWTTIRTRNTDGIALATFSMMGLGSLFFVLQGIYLGNIPLIATNTITFVCALIIFVIKMYNDYFKKKK